LEAGMKNTAEIRKAESRNRIARIYPQMTQIDAEIGRGGDRVHDLVGWKRKKIYPPRKTRKRTVTGAQEFNASAAAKALADKKSQSRQGARKTGIRKF